MPRGSQTRRRASSISRSTCVGREVDEARGEIGDQFLEGKQPLEVSRLEARPRIVVFLCERTLQLSPHAADAGSIETVHSGAARPPSGAPHGSPGSGGGPSRAATRGSICSRNAACSGSNPPAKESSREPPVVEGARRRAADRDPSAAATRRPARSAAWVRGELGSAARVVEDVGDTIASARVRSRPTQDRMPFRNRWQRQQEQAGNPPVSSQEAEP